MAKTFCGYCLTTRGNISSEDYSKLVGKGIVMKYNPYYKIWFVLYRHRTNGIPLESVARFFNRGFRMLKDLGHIPHLTTLVKSANCSAMGFELKE